MLKAMSECYDQYCCCKQIADRYRKRASRQSLGHSASIVVALVPQSLMKMSGPTRTRTLFVRCSRRRTLPNSFTTDRGNKAELGQLAVFSGLSEFPVRVKCTSSSLASTWTAAQYKLRRRCMETESNRPRLAEKTLDLCGGWEHSCAPSPSPWCCGSRPPRLLGVVAWVERNSRPGCGLLKCCHSEL